MRRIRIGAACVLLLCGGAATAGAWIADPKTGCQVWNPRPSPGESIGWAGQCKDGFAEGEGVLDWFRGGKPYERDEGRWIAGRQRGVGAQTWPGGSYKGELFDGLPHGQGVLIADGVRYDGAWANGTPSGVGTLTNENGTFSGTWRDGCFNDGKRRASLGVALQSCP